nr:hypothetical protein Iba_chr13aCG12960 [Ipomoea batatas]
MHASIHHMVMRTGHAIWTKFSHSLVFYFFDLSKGKRMRQKAGHHLVQIGIIHINHILIVILPTRSLKNVLHPKLENIVREYDIQACVNVSQVM